ncbi:MAG: transporter [bacterium]|nr:transporter [bacterium]
MRKNLFVMVSMLILFCGQAFAAHPLITDDTGTQGKGHLQIEINSEFSSNKEETIRETSAEIGIGLCYGINDNTDIVIGMPNQWNELKEDNVVTSDENGLADVSLEVKHAFYEKNGLSFALKPGISFPTGDNEKGLGSGKATYSVFFITTKGIESGAFHFNLGYIRNENKADEEENIWHASLASEIEIMKNLKAVGNIGIEKNPDKTSDINPAFILGGLIYSIKENIDIDFGVKFGLNSAETDNSILAGITLKY